MKRPKVLLGVLISLALIVSMVMSVPTLASDIKGSKNSTDVPDKYYIGSTIHYEMFVENPEGNPCTNNLTDVYDTLPDLSTHYFVQGGVDPPLIQAQNETMIYNLDYIVDETDLIEIPAGPDAGRYGVINYFDAHGWDSCGDPVDVHTGWTSVVLRPDIDIEKTVDFDGNGIYSDLESNVPGETARWKIVVCNSGYDPVYNIMVTDTNGQSFGPFDLVDNGDCQTFTYDEVINADKVNTAEAVGEDELGTPVGPVQDDAEVRVSHDVGGTAFLVDKWGLLAPWAILLGCAGVVTLLLLRKRREA